MEKLKPPSELKFRFNIEENKVGETEMNQHLLSFQINLSQRPVLKSVEPSGGVGEGNERERDASGVVFYA